MRACRDEFGAPIGHLTYVGPGEYHRRGMEMNRRQDEQSEMFDEEIVIKDTSRPDAGRMIMSHKHWEEYKFRKGLTTRNAL